MTQVFLSPRAWLLAAALVALATSIVYNAAPAQAHPGHADHDWPEFPRNVRAAPGDGKLTLTWREPSAWNDHPPVGYQIDIAAGEFYGSDDPPTTSDHTDWEPLATVAVTATSYTFTGTILEGASQEHSVTNGVKYHLRIRAVSAPGSDPDDRHVSDWVVASGTPTSAPQLQDGQAGMVVQPTSLIVPVGSRACYRIRPNTKPSAALAITTTSGDTTKATVASQNISDWRVSDSGVNWKVGYANCVKGVAAGSVTITHSVTSDDANYDEAAVPSVSVTVTGADTKPTVRFLHSEVRAVEASTDCASNPGLCPYGEGSVHNYQLKKVKVKLDIAPSPSSHGQITWYIPYPGCGRDGGTCYVADYNGTARYNIDYMAEGLIGRQVPYVPNSNDMDFEFYIRSDDEIEDDETVQVYLLNQKFVLGSYIEDNNDVCVGSCAPGYPSMTFRIIDDDTSSPYLIARIKKWRNDPRYVSDKAHTDRWDRVLLAFGETVADTSLTAMTAAEAQGYADLGWGRWEDVAEALTELESR